MKKITLISILIFLIDLITKQIIVHNFYPNQSLPIIPNFFSITYVKNTGVAFSLLEGNIPFIILVTCIIIFLLINYLKEQEKTPLSMITYSLIIGGALGNLIDRIRYHYVIDFLDFYINSYHFPIFNIADICIVIGISLIVITSIKESRNTNGINRK